MYYRSPNYIDVDRLVPLADLKGIAVNGEIAVTVRGAKSQSGSKAAGADAHIFNASGERAGSDEKEVTRHESGRVHPVAGLNKLLDVLEADSPPLATDLPHAPEKRRYIQLEREWQISDATDLGGLLKTTMEGLAAHPEAMQRREPPMELMQAFFSPNESTQQRLVIESVERDERGYAVILLVDIDLLVSGVTTADLERELQVFGQIEDVVSEESSYSLEPYFMSGVSRPVRRHFPSEKLVPALAQMAGADLSESALTVDGPVVVIRPVAIY